MRFCVLCIWVCLCILCLFPEVSLVLCVHFLHSFHSRSFRGTGDKYLDTALASDSVKFHRNCSVKFVEGASHWVQQERPQVVNEHMRKFLRGGELRHK